MDDAEPKLQMPLSEMPMADIEKGLVSRRVKPLSEEEALKSKD
jgi:hypothetical protein